jgi:Eco57I restriction-modification methylase
MPTLFSDEALTQPVRDAIHAFALNGRELLTREARDLLEGVYGLHSDGILEAPENLPALKDAEARQTYERLKRSLKDETQAGLAAEEAVNKLVKEIAFTHLNRLVAFKMLERNKLIREAVGRGTESNGFKFYLADHPEDEAHWRAGRGERAYINFLRWQAGEIAREVPVLFDADDLPSHLFPRMAVLNQALAELNDSELAAAWHAEETIGWVYQYFNEPELQAAFAAVRLSGTKFEAQDIPAATQLFTLRWIVRYLVENTLGRLWIHMHPDSNLRADLRYLVPSAGEAQTEKMRPVKEISLLDPACGTMHFGLVAFDLLAEMYREELRHAGTPGWPEQASVANEADIPAAILEHNLFGIDIDMRATQLAALTLYVKAKRMNRSAQLLVHNLACADVLPFSTTDLGRFLVEMRFTNPIFEKMLRRIREQLADIQQVGSLLRIERELRSLVDEQRRKDTQKRLSKYGDGSNQLGLLDADEQAAMEAEYYGLLEAQLVQALDFFRQQAARQGEDLRFFTGEVTKSLRVLDLFLRRYDVVVANPPYLSRRKMNDTLAAFLDKQYPEGKGDLYAAFILRCLELTEENGYVGMLTMHSFMFISSYEQLRQTVDSQAQIETLAHLGPGLFATGNPGTLQTAAFVLRCEADAARRKQNVGTYFRLVHAPDADAKRVAFEQALQELRKQD